MKTLLLTILAFVSLQLNAQTWVPVPDTNFQTYLTAHYSVGAFMTSGGNFYIDSDHPDIQSVTILSIPLQNFSSIEGVQAFENLVYLYCNENSLTSLPDLPSSLIYLNCRNNALTTLPNMPPSLEFLLCQNNQLTTLPSLPNTLKILECNWNNLTELPDPLPNALEELSCETNQLMELPPIPPSVFSLACGVNQLTQLPDLSNTNIVWFTCYYNQLTSLPQLPVTLKRLECFQNQLIDLPDLPNGLKFLRCFFNELVELPILPDSLIVLECYSNQLTELPTLPDSLGVLECGDNQLIALPDLPASLSMLNCVGNQISCFKRFSENFTQILIEQNPFTCLPNYGNYMSPEVLTYPLCDITDLVNNPNGCDGTSSIFGQVFQDMNSDCINNGNVLSYIPLRMYNSQGNLIASHTSDVNGNYNFSSGPGTYELIVDTINVSHALMLTCPSGNSTAVVTAMTPVVSGGDFGLVCNGFDLGVQSIVPTGWVFPGQSHNFAVLAGDMTAQYNINCASGVSGEVSVEVSGPGTVIFAGSPTTISGNSAVYSIADFGALNLSEFLASVLTDTTALEGDQFCVSVMVTTPTTGELNAANNIYMYCYQVVNSYDPNVKETSPEVVRPGYTDEFTYTIHFQNTGNAPAFNIRLADTLDSNLDLTTFKVVNASDDFTTTLNPQTRLLTVRFPNIMLPDSASNPTGSIGFIQYRIKPLSGLTDGTIIENTAYIYFDFNTPISTNTSENLFSETAGFSELAEETIQLYPNPSDKQVFVRSENNIEKVFLYDLNGMQVKTVSPNAKNTLIDVSDLESGIYITTVQTNQSVVTKRLIVR